NPVLAARLPNDARPYTNSELSRTPASHRPSGDQASEWTVLISASRVSPLPSAAMTRTLSPCSNAIRVPSGDHFGASGVPPPYPTEYSRRTSPPVGGMVTMLPPPESPDTKTSRRPSGDQSGESCDPGRLSVMFTGRPPSVGCRKILALLSAAPT